MENTKDEHVCHVACATISESNVTNMFRYSDSFSTVPSMVNGGDWGCIVCDLETIIVLVLLAFNFILKGHTTH